MRHILIIGAGKSTSYLIKYLLEKSESEKLHLTIGDLDVSSAKKLLNNQSNTAAIKLDVFDETSRVKAITKADIVISMLPARFHIEVAKTCIALKKHMITASYISNEMKMLDEQAKANGLIFMNEMGVDPGIDHMSAMQLINRIRNQGGKVILFESFTGGLVAPECDTNLWNYKFTWNPRNVVLAGQGSAAKFIQENAFKYIPYNRLFRRTEFLEIDHFGRFEAYANRNSLDYKEAYNLKDVRTIYRGTIRRVGFSRAWNIFVQLGMTDDSYIMENSHKLSNRNFVNAFLPYSPTDSVELKLRSQLNIDQDDIIWEKLEELDLFNPNKKTGLKNATPAQILQKILENHWTLLPQDKDMIVMYHKIGYELNGKNRQIDATMVSIGENQTYTSMAKTVGLPLAIGTLAILNGVITTPGVHLPTTKEVYEPILEELKQYNIHFNEKEVPYLGYNPLNR